MMFWKKHWCPKWAEKRILSEYKQAIKNVERTRKDDYIQRTINANNGKMVRLLQAYSFAVGEAAAIEAIMDRLFIPYDDKGKLKEFYL